MQLKPSKNLPKKHSFLSFSVIMGPFINLESNTIFFWRTESNFNTLKNDWNNKLLIIEKDNWSRRKIEFKTLAEIVYYHKQPTMNKNCFILAT